MGSLIHSEEFASTLKEARGSQMNSLYSGHQDGLLVAPSDFLRSLKHPRPYFRRGAGYLREVSRF
eukprot:Skav205166  [mRNA]  locus=scaffold2773:53670:55430:- [translate_table: standard]